jgi:hypothetical protein
VEQVIGSRDALGDGADARFSGKSAASWPAIFAGAFVAIAASLILAALGSGLGFAEISPWHGHGVSATTFTVTAAIWLIVTQWISAALGGYIAGRLRTRWIGTHTHEVFFRDTAHGLVTWSLATVLIAGLLAGSLSSMVGGGLHALSHAGGGGGAMAGGMGPGAGAEGEGSGPGMMSGPMPPAPPALAYEVDKLFRPAAGTAPVTGTAGAAPAPGNAAASEGSASTEMDTGSDPRGEALYIALHTMSTGSISEGDRAYLAQRVSLQAGIPTAEAQRRVDDFLNTTLATEAKVKAAADKARKGAAETAIYLALSMLVGAFIASVSAALGGRLRDEHP